VPVVRREGAKGPARVSTSIAELVDKPCPSCGHPLSAFELVIDDDGFVRHENQEDEWGGHLFDVLEVQRRNDAELERWAQDRRSEFLKQSGHSISARGLEQARLSDAEVARLVWDRPLSNKTGR
jgi:hypothetical protein